MPPYLSHTCHETCGAWMLRKSVIAFRGIPQALVRDQGTRAAHTRPWLPQLCPKHSNDRVLFESADSAVSPPPYEHGSLFSPSCVAISSAVIKKATSRDVCIHSRTFVRGWFVFEVIVGSSQVRPHLACDTVCEVLLCFSTRFQ